MKEEANHSQSVEFNGLILGFSSAALYYLGETKIEGKKAAEINLPLAKQNIDIIEMLKVKTLGNLNEDEAILLAQVIKDLRAKFELAANK